MDKFFTALVKELKRLTKLQQIPIVYTDLDYADMIVHGLKQLYVDLCIAEEYDADVTVNGIHYKLNRKLSITEEEYVLVCALMDFYQVVQQDVNTIVGYSTDSLSLTNADKPYQNIAGEIEKLNKRSVELFFKLQAERE